MTKQTHADSNRTEANYQYAEDPRREPHEKETTLALEGDRQHFAITSFKRGVFAKLHQRPRFEVTRFHILDDDHRVRTVTSLDQAEVDPPITIVGVAGQLPVGTFTIGVPRNSNSHTDIVK
jgi:hypothetical protein